MYDRVIAACHERWRQGSEAFRRLFGGGTTRLPAKKIIRSAVYGNMWFKPEEMRFIESFYLQRLRHVSQMGLLHLVYPDARHSRFEHSLGVLWSLRSLLQADDEVANALDDVEKKTLFFAALLHDSGHGPFSHTTESLLEMSGLDKQLRRVIGGEGPKVKPHERRCRDMIQDTDFHLENLGIESYGLRQALEELGVDPEHVVRLVLGLLPSPLLNLVSGDFDVDKMDYFRRDAFFTGTTGGGVDMEVMQRWVRIFRQDGRYAVAAYDSRIVGHLLHLLFSREHVYSITAYHPVARIPAALLLIAGDLALRALPATVAADIFSNIELLDDREFLSVLELAAQDVTNDEGDLLRRVIQRLYLRRLPKRLATLPRTQFIERFHACIPSIEAEGKGELPTLVYCRISEIADGKYLPLITGLKKDEIAILELTPQLGSSSAGTDAFAKERATLDGILISAVRRSDPVPMGEWLDAYTGAGAADAQAKALRTYKLALWRALVLVPASLKYALAESNQVDAFQRDFADALGKEGVRRPFGRTRVAWAPAQRLVGSKLQTWRDALSVRGGSG